MNVVLIGEGQPMELARLLAPTGTRLIVTSLEDAAAELHKLAVPVGTLYIVAHATEKGDIKFGEKEGFVTAAKIAEKLKGALSVQLAPTLIDFRACNVGKSPEAMKSIGTAVGTKKMRAGDCYIVWVANKGPIRMGHEGQWREILREEDIEAGAATEAEKVQRRSVFLKELKKAAAEHPNDGKCIINKGSNGYFRGKGIFVSVFFNPAFSKEWVGNKSVCYDDAVKAGGGGTKGTCRLVDIDLTTVSDVLDDLGATIKIEKALHP